HIRANTDSLRYSRPFMGGAASISAAHSVGASFGTAIPGEFSRLELWQSAVKNFWENPRQNTNVGGKGSCNKPAASSSNPRDDEPPKASARRAAVPALSRGCACSSATT